MGVSERERREREDTVDRYISEASSEWERGSFLQQREKHFLPWLLYPESNTPFTPTKHL